jgi:hypothetical protein
MNKIFNRQLFRTSARKPSAHGSGITQLVVDGKPVQGFAYGTGDRGVEDPRLIDPNPMYADPGMSDLPEIGVPASEEPRTQVASNAPVAPAAAAPEPPVVAPAAPQTPVVPPSGVATVPADNVAALGQKYAEMFQKMYPTRSAEQILAERQKLVGTGKEDLQLQAALALMKMGGKIMQTPGSLASAIGAGITEATPDLMKASAENAKQQRELKLSSLDAAEREHQMKAQLGLKGLETALSQSFTSSEAEKGRASSEKLQKLSQEFQGQQNTMNREQQNTLQAGNHAFQRDQQTASQTFQSGQQERSFGHAIGLNTANHEFQLLTRDPKTFVDLSDPNKPTFGSYKLNKEGKYVNDQGAERPAASLEFTAQVAKMVTPEFSEPKTAYVPDTTQLTGMRPVTVQTDKRTDKLVQLNADGTRSPLQEGFILRGQNEFVDRKNLGNGYYELTVKEGPFKDTTIQVDSAGRIQNTDDLRAKGIDPSKITGQGPPPSVGQQGAVQQTGPQIAEVLPASAVQYRDQAITAAAEKRGSRSAGTGEITGQGAQRYLVEAQPGSSIRPSDIPEKERAAIQTRNIQAERTMRALENATQEAYTAVGLGPKLKSLATEVFDPLVPGVDLAFLKNEQNKLQLRNLQKQVIGAFAQNTDRVSVYEQQLLKELGPDPEAWLANPQTALAKLRELHRLVANDAEASRATLEGRPALVLKRMPNGTNDDPFTQDFVPYMTYLQSTGKREQLVGKQYRDNSGNVITIK